MSKFVTLHGFGGSGGSELNFDVIPYKSEESLLAATPPENTIGVVTTTPISSWIFSATEPTGSNGMIWISTGTSSTVTFNALKNNDIEIYPRAVKQYVSGAWVKKIAKSYQNNVWVDWSTIFVENGSVLIKPKKTISVSTSTGNGLWKIVAQGDSHFSVNFKCDGYAGKTIYVEVAEGFINLSGYTCGIVLRTTPLEAGDGTPSFTAQTMFETKNATCEMVNGVYELKIPENFNAGYFAVHAETYLNDGYIHIKNIWIA